MVKKLYPVHCLRFGWVLQGIYGTSPEEAVVSYFPPTAEDSQVGLRCICQVDILVPETQPLSHEGWLVDILTLSCLNIDQRDL